VGHEGALYQQRFRASATNPYHHRALVLAGDPLTLLHCAGTMPAMPCSWCGEPHASDHLCQRATRGVTRRSFCFLFGAGIAAAVLPLPTWAEATPAHVLADAFTTIQYSLQVPSTATFRTRDTALRLGHTLTLSFPEMGILFNGTVDRIDTHDDGSREVHAVDAIEFAARRPDAYGYFY